MENNDIRHPADGFTKDGRPVYNLLCCEITKLNEAIPYINAVPSVIIANDWMKAIISSVIDTETTEIFYFNEANFKLLLSNLD